MVPNVFSDLIMNNYLLQLNMLSTYSHGKQSFVMETAECDWALVPRKRRDCRLAAAAAAGGHWPQGETVEDVQLPCPGSGHQCFARLGRKHGESHDGGFRQTYLFDLPVSDTVDQGQGSRRVSNAYQCPVKRHNTTPQSYSNGHKITNHTF